MQQAEAEAASTTTSSSNNKVVVDCGGGLLKVGFAGQTQPTRIIPNQVVKAKRDRKKYVGDEVEECRDTSALHYSCPFEKGYLMNWEVQKEVLDRAFGKSVLNIETKESELLMTQPLFNPVEPQEVACEVIFEDYSFRSLFSPTAAMMSVVQHKNAAIAKNEYDPLNYCGGIVVDTGYSFTHVVPYFDDFKLNYATKRINIGGKALTNYLKEVISFRAWNMMEETFLMNVVKERLCYVSLNFMQDLELTKKKENPIVRHYVLPDYTTTDRGHVVTQPQLGPMPPPPDQSNTKGEDQQILVMNNERIVVPEVLFHPSDIGIEQAGVAEAIVQAVQAAHPDLHPVLYGNISVCGGNALLPGFQERLYNEVRQRAPSNMEVKVTQAESPIAAAWQGAAQFMLLPNYDKCKVTKEEYEENGPSLCVRRFSMY